MVWNHIGGPLASGGLLGADQTGGHVRLALDGIGVEMVAAGGAHVDEDRVVLGGPAAPRLRAVVVRPHQLVQERIAAEDLVEQKLAVMGLAVVDVEVQGSGGARSSRARVSRGCRNAR